MPAALGRRIFLIALLRIHVVGASAAEKTSLEVGQPSLVRRQAAFGSPNQKVVLVTPVLQEVDEAAPPLVVEHSADLLEDSFTIPQTDAASQLPTDSRIVAIDASGVVSESFPSSVAVPPTIIAPRVRAWPSRNGAAGRDSDDGSPETIQRDFNSVPAQFQRRVEQIESQQRVQEEAARAQRLEADRLTRERVEVDRRVEEMQNQQRAQETFAEAQRAETARLARERAEVHARQAEGVRSVASVDMAVAPAQAAAERLQAAVEKLQTAEDAVGKQRAEVEARDAETKRRVVALDESTALGQAAAESLQATVVKLQKAQHVVEEKQAELDAHEAETAQRAAAVNEAAAVEKAAADNLHAEVVELDKARHAVEEQLARDH